MGDDGVVDGGKIYRFLDGDESRWGYCCGVFVGLELGGGALGEAKYSCELWVLFWGFIHKNRMYSIIF